MSKGGQEPQSKGLQGVEYYFRQLVELLHLLARPRQVVATLRASAGRRRRAVKDYLASFRDPRLRAIPGTLLAWATVSRMLVIFVALVVPAWVLQIVDPFGLSGAVEGHSQTIFQKATAPFYPNTAQSQIAVVLIDQPALARRGESWPPRYLYYEEVIRRVAKQGPSAIFLDVLLEDRRPYDDSLPLALAALEDTLASTGVPLYLATLDDGQRNLFAQVPGTQLAMAGWSGLNGDYPLLVGEDNRYGRMASAGHGQCSADSPPTAAFALYRQLCEQGVQQGCPEGVARGEVERFCSPMVVQWGYNVAPEVRARDLLSASQCKAPDQSVGGRFLSSMQILWSSLLTSFHAETAALGQQTCPYTLTVREEDLSSARSRGLLKDRVVLIGTSLAGIHDLVESPVHGQLPGVYLHAMALDNLLTWHDRYFTRGDTRLTMLGLGLLLAWVTAALMRANPARLDALLLAFAIVLVLGVSAFFHFALRRPPLDWLGLLLVYELARRMLQRAAEEPDPPQPTGRTS